MGLPRRDITKRVPAIVIVMEKNVWKKGIFNDIPLGLFIFLSASSNYIIQCYTVCPFHMNVMHIMYLNKNQKFNECLSMCQNVISH